MYESLADQFYDSKLCTKALKCLRNHSFKSKALYKLEVILYSPLRFALSDVFARIKSYKPSYPVPESHKDFSFMNFINDEVLRKFEKKLRRPFLLYGFEQINSYVENLATSRIIESNQISYTSQIALKTENISQRINSLMSQISGKKELEKNIKIVPKLRMSRVALQDPHMKKEYIMSNRCEDLSDDITDISRYEVCLKVVKAWKKFMFQKKALDYKVYSMRKLKFARVAKKIITAMSEFSKTQKIKNTRNFLVLNVHYLKLMRISFGELYKTRISGKKIKKYSKNKIYIIKKTLIEHWKIFLKGLKSKNAHYSRVWKFLRKKLLVKYFKLLKIRAKEIQISKNHKELTIVYYSDKICKLALTLLIKAVTKSKLHRAQKLLASQHFFKIHCKRIIRYFKFGVLESKNSANLKNLSKQHFIKSNKKKFIKALYTKNVTHKNYNQKLSLARDHYVDYLLRCIMFTWASNVKNFKDKKLKRYRSFLIHCKNLIEKGFYGWKKIYPRLRYRRYRSLRLENNINWNIIDSYFCEWIRRTGEIVNKSNHCDRLYKLKIAKKVFDSWLCHHWRVQKKYLDWKNKLNYMKSRKTKIVLDKFKAYMKKRDWKYSQKHYAQLIYTDRIFRKWNLLCKKKILLKWITSYHYFKYIFRRWKNYSYECRYSFYAVQHHFCLLKKKVIIKWRKHIKMRQLNFEKLESYRHYKNQKDCGIFFDQWVKIYDKVVLEKCKSK
ncbi:hypothetical protein SteCoe_18060 [Stentor coeruleus]|uniref:Sfi1 spindle body domain-containing protein n=1 Tax=Stentor coeruleus TaxID=5963 RepID=A0A1R2BXV4_9CILI|nr:hypothetical protein SteCoe_18060 [Stentor coeruleus]